MDNLDKDIAMAERLGYGVHYGAYKADHPLTKAPEPEPIHPETKSEPDAVCPICGKTFEKTHALQMFCGQKCREISNRRRALARYDRKMGSIQKLVCPTCKGEFQPVHRKQKYCCERCQRRRQREK